jgi:hypothetical protein
MPWPEKTQRQHELIKLVPWTEVLELVDEMLDGGMDKDEALDEIAKILDTLLPLTAIPEVGPLLEALDGPILRAALAVIVAFAGDPKQRAARKERREKKKADRKTKKK